jgi:hypothetical protein
MAITSLIVPSFAQADPYQYVKVQDSQLLVDFDEDGVYEPYIIKGVGYAPYPIGRHVSDWGYEDPNDPRPDNIYDDSDILNRDFELLQEMNVNTIRIWKGNNTQDGLRFPNKITQNTLDSAEAHGIKVIAGFWIDTSGPWCDGQQIQYTPPAFLDPSNCEYTYQRTNIVFKFKAYVEQFKDHPAILFWAIGNENNNFIPSEYAPYWYSLINQMAYEAHLSEGATYHPVAVVNGDLGYVGDPAAGASDALMPSLDIWGANVYRGEVGNSFGDLFDDYASRTNKPLWISEFGIDAWFSTNLSNPDEGYEDQERQALWAGKLWDEIISNSDITIGATIMEYSDEWWKPYEWMYLGSNYVQDHFGYGPRDTDCPPDGVPDWYPPSPDSYFNEEWWGVMAIEENPIPYQPNIMNPRMVYDTLQDRFACGVNSRYYVGPDNGKSCDGSHACCSFSNMKSKRGLCVNSCGKKIKATEVYPPMH